MTEFIVKRMKKFMFNETVNVAMPRTYTFNSKLIENGLILKYNHQEILLSESMKSCQELSL